MQPAIKKQQTIARIAWKHLDAKKSKRKPEPGTVKESPPIVQVIETYADRGSYAREVSRLCFCQDETVSTLWRAGVIPLNNHIGRHIPRSFAIGCIVLLLFGVLAAVWVELTGDEKLLLRRILDGHPALILTCVSIFLSMAVIAALWIFQHYIEPPGKLVDEEKALPFLNSLLTELAFTAFDTETTGLRPSEGDEIVSIGGVRIVNGRMLREETFDRLIDPGRPISRESTQVHGIDDAMVKGQPDIRDALPAFSRFAQETVLVGHNAAFDMRFFQIKEEPTGVTLRMPVLDTILLSAVVHPHHEDHSIEGIAVRLGVNIAGRHTALGDAIVTGELFLKLIPLLADKGIRTLGEALEASRKTYLARVKY